MEPRSTSVDITKDRPVRMHSPHAALAAFGLALTLAACGSSPTATTTDPNTSTCPVGTPDCDDTPGIDVGEEQGGSMNMCAQDVPDCNDMEGGDPFATCPVGTPDCNDTPAGDEPPTDPGGDRFMSDEVPIVTQFTDPNTRSVEMAPGTIAETFTVFLQEAVVDGRMVSVSFSGGEAPCFVVDHVEFTETDDEILVSVLVGTADPDADCDTTPISMQSVSFELSSDIGSRLIVDGSRTTPDNANA